MSLQVSSVEPDTLAGEVATTDTLPAGAGFPVEQERGKKRKAWSFPEFDEPKPERPPLTEEEWQRVLRGKRHTMTFLVTREQRAWAGNQARSCGTCSRVHLNGDPRRGFCVAQKMMTGLTFPVLCREHAE